MTKPTLIERALRRVGYVKWRPASVIHRVDSGVMGNPTPITAPEIAEAAKYAGVYMASPWVYVAVNRIAEAAALVPFQVVALPVGVVALRPCQQQQDQVLRGRGERQGHWYLYPVPLRHYEAPPVIVQLDNKPPPALRDAADWRWQR